MEKKLGASVMPRKLLDIGKICLNQVREFDVVARKDVSEFAILLPKTHFTGSLVVATRIWRSFQKEKVGLNAELRDVDLCIGIAFQAIMLL